MDHNEYNENEEQLPKHGVENIPHNMKKPPKLSVIKAESTSAESTNTSDMVHIRKWRRLLTNKLKNRRKNKSNFTSRLVKTQAEWTYPDISEPFLSTPNMCRLKGKTEEDNLKVDQTESVLNTQYNEDIDRVGLIDRLAHILVDDGTVILRSGWVTEVSKVVEQEPQYSFEEISPVDPINGELLQQYNMLSNPLIAQANQVDINSFPPEIKIGYSFSRRVGKTVKAIPNGFKDITVEKQTKNQPTIDAFHYEDCYVDPNANGDANKAKFCIFRIPTSTSDLLKQPERYFNVDSIKDTDKEATSSEIDEEEGKVTSFEYLDKTQKIHDLYEYWGYGDIEDDGIATPFVISWIGDVVVRLEKHPLPEMGLPIAIIQYSTEVRKNFGTAQAELLHPMQNNIGALTRGILDVMAVSANGQRGYRAGSLDPINEQRFLNNQHFKFGGNTPDPRSIFHTFTYPELPSSVFKLIDDQQHAGEILTGTQPFGAEGISRGSSVNGMRNVMDATSKRRMSILRRVARGLETMSKHIILMNSKYLSTEEITGITNNKYARLTPADISGSFHTKIVVSTPEQDQVRAQDLTMLLQTMGPSSPPDLANKIMAEIAELRGMHEFSDMLKEYKPQPDPHIEEVKALEKDLLRAQIKNELGKAYENQSNGDFDQARVKTEQAKALKYNAEAALAQATKEKLDLDFVEQAKGVKQEREKELASHKGKKINA